MRPELLLALVGGCLLNPTAIVNADDEAVLFEHFEKKIRPILVEYCFSCNSAEAK